MATLENRFEYAGTRDRFYDYCRWEYTPAVGWRGKFRSVNLLYHSFDAAGLGEPAYAFVRALREGFGAGRTVWGVKLRGGELSWEFYFYDYRRRERRRSISRFLEILRPFAPCGIRPNENLPYFMFSVDVTPALVAGEKPLERVHMYIGNPGSSVSSGICYALEEDRTRLENFYFFFDTDRHLEDAASKAACSAYLDTTVLDAREVFRPGLTRCRTICVANKQENDCIYFSRIDVDQLLLFLREMAYPSALTAFLEENRADLDHLLYDVGFDYRMAGGKLEVLKSGYYGFF